MQEYIDSKFWSLDNTPVNILNQRFFTYVATLESPLNDLALNRQIYRGDNKSERISTLLDVYPLTISLPWMLKGVLIDLNEVDLINVSEAGTLLVLATLIYDHYLDGQLGTDGDALLLYHCLYTAGLQKFHSLFDAKSLFWSYFNHYRRQYISALLQERKHWEHVTEFSIDAMWYIGSGKAAYLKTISTALALIGRAESYIPYIETSVDAFTAALQLGDDIMDWAEDYQQKRYTLPLTQVIPPEQWQMPVLSIPDIKRSLENSIIMETLLKQAIEWHKLAVNSVAELDCVNFTHFHRKKDKRG